MTYIPKLDWIDYDPLDPLNPDAIPTATDMIRIEQGIADAYTAIGEIPILAMQKQKFTSSGNFTVPQTGTYKVTVTGGGGSQGSTTSYCVGGGGAGGTAIKWVSLVKDAIIAVTVGAVGAPAAPNGNDGHAGGTSSFGGYCSATGGDGGGGSTGTCTSGGAGGTASNGDINLDGCRGGYGIASILGNQSGDGGASYWGGGYGKGDKPGVVVIEYLG